MKLISYILFAIVTVLLIGLNLYLFRQAGESSAQLTTVRAELTELNKLSLVSDRQKKLLGDLNKIGRQSATHGFDLLAQVTPDNFKHGLILNYSDYNFGRWNIYVPRNAELQIGIKAIEGIDSDEIRSVGKKLIQEVHVSQGSGWHSVIVRLDDEAKPQIVMLMIDGEITRQLKIGEEKYSGFSHSGFLNGSKLIERHSIFSKILQVDGSGYWCVRTRQGETERAYGFDVEVDIRVKFDEGEQ